jgi:two-component system, LytTR family, response regulator
LKKITAILVDDEESARDVLQNLLLRFCPEVDLIARCENVKQAVEVIGLEQPELVFLDIEMPNYAGYELVNFFKKVNFEIVFVTAYNQYAIRAFEMAAVDYLLKPIDITRLKNAVARVIQYRDKEQQSQRLAVLEYTLENKKFENIAISDKGQQHIISIANIIAIEAQESYCIIHTSAKQQIVSKNLKHFEKLFEPIPLFIRVHKSWIINKKHLKHYSKSELTIQLSNGLVARLSKYKKSEFETAILS